mgnify:CR=1 FL=1
MKKEDVFTRAFLKPFKSGEEFNLLLHPLQKRGVEQLLEGEMDAYLGCEKRQPSDGANVRNGHTGRKIKSSFGVSEISVPRDRDSTISPMLLPKRRGILEGIQSIIISL